MKKIFFLISFIILSNYNSYGQRQSKFFSLPDFIKAGLERNYAIRMVRNEEEIAKNNRTWGNAGFLPTIDLNGGYNASLADTRSKDSSNVVTTANDIYNNGLNAGVTLEWTIFDGMKMQATYEKLKELRKMGELQTRLSIESLVGQIAAEYYNQIYQLLRLKNLETTVDLSRERVRIIEARYQIGAASYLDLNQAKADLNADVSKQISQQEVVNYSSINLNKLLASEHFEDSVRLADTSISLDLTLDYDVLKDKMLDVNANLLMAAADKRLSESDEKALKSRYFPYLKLNAGYGYTLNRYETGSTKENQSLAFNYGITIGMNLFEGLNLKRELRNTRLETENRDLNRLDLRLNLLATLSNFYLSYQNNQKLLMLEQQNQDVAKAYYEAAVDKYKLGSLSGIELREAQQSLLDAGERLLLATYNIKVYEISLKQLSGDILSYLEQ